MSVRILSPSEQLARHLREEMLKGRWIEELPGTPSLASEMQVDRKTITAALEILEDEGLTEPQGLGRSRRITLSSRHTRRLNIQILLNGDNDQPIFLIYEIMQRLRQAGHNVTIAQRSLLDMGMDVSRLQRFVHRNAADAWIVLAAPHSILEWFASQDQSAFAVFGRRHRISIPSVGPDKEQAIRRAVRRLTELGHRRIVYLSRDERRESGLGHIERSYLEELRRCGISVSPECHLPDWQDDRDGFEACLRSLLKDNRAAPTAIIVDEREFFFAALLYLTQANVAVPNDISLVCSDAQALFDWCHPRVAHIRWDKSAVVDRVLQWIRQLARRRTVHNKAYYTAAEFIEGGTIGPVVENSQ
ncbi:hypothetical protein DDZ13_12130 [Coraliomargarita sinensis]|uniref:Transcriptional regulator LacI/GalR-like sensor domain-containing protein n=1 Tax=Coraliomargarita sinensis TaxID=2174842 RepID=A0A317ZDP8_9BACT|nr:substrate-binding domain-containing protein [Coraliomargarita sinensis]PXA03435.1 hypothetical protein DDZ13_12130 [Coraliomargarita sinensis]